MLRFFLSLLLCFTLIVPAYAAPPAERWIYMSANLYVDKVEDLLAVLRTAKAAGANTVVFEDTKATSYSAPAFAAEKKNWLGPMRRLRDGIHALDMKLIISAFSTGYCDAVQAHDVNVVTGYPVQNVPLVVKNRKLMPVATADIGNGSFENYRNHDPAWWDFQDAPGAATFIDTGVSKAGAASLRFEPAAGTGGQSRIFANFSVKPFQHYKLRFWVRSEGLTAGYLGPSVTKTNSARSLTGQGWSVSNAEGERSYFQSASNLTLGWTEMQIGFNSLDASEVSLGLGAWDITAGRMWIDDVRLETVPFLNVIRRGDLPLGLTSGKTGLLKEGRDFVRIVDPKLGMARYPGRYDSNHAAPVVSLPQGSRLREGDRVSFNGCHAIVTHSGASGCSWNTPQTAVIARRVFRALERDINPDGYLFGIDEVRTGGYEPADKPYGSSAAALAAHASRIAKLIRSETGHKPYVWSDMFDPEANAVANYYQVKGSLKGVGRLISPADMAIVNWRANEEPGNGASAKRSVAFFQSRGFKQVVAGFYDLPVATNHAQWQAALEGSSGIAGSMYTSWVNDYSKLPAFGDLWWK